MIDNNMTTYIKHLYNRVQTAAGHDPLTEQDYQSDDEMPVDPLSESQQPCLMAQATTCAQCLSLVLTS